MADAAAQFRISVDIAHAIEALQASIDDALFPRVTQAVRAIAGQASFEWKAAVMNARLWEGEKQPYANSITWEMTGPYSAMVWTDYHYAEEIDNGRPARDLKKMLQTSLKVRTTSKGKRYLIIPFRHNTPGNEAHGRPMPPDVHKIVSSDDFKKSRVLSMSTRPSGTGAFDIRTRKLLTVPKAHYQWGSRLENGLTAKLSPRHANAPTDGMVRMKTSSGAQNSSAYLTFRVMMEGSPKWIVPARPGLNIVRQLIERLQPVANQVVAAAVAKDLT